ncbi:MAG TPA: serine/threonine-protein kinase [Polyangia bacterium]
MLRTDTVLAASQRLTSRWASSLPHPGARAVSGSSVALPMLRQEERSLLGLTDGQRTVAEIIRLSLLPATAALRHLTALCGRGILVIVEPAAPVKPLGNPPSESDALNLNTEVVQAAGGDEKATESAAKPFRVGEYQVALRLGQGGMASSYLCRRVGAGGFQRLFTLKVVRQHVHSAHAVTSFQREARVSGLVDHPNIQRVVDVGTYKTQPYLVLDYVDGATLSDWLVDGGRPPAPITVALMLDLLRALAHAHSRTDDDGRPVGLIHADVSPQNLLIGADGVARLTDFGSARLTSNDAAADHAANWGKPRYMAPEQLCSQPLDARTDLFAAGAVMWEALTGRALFADASYEETVLKVMKRDIPAPSTFGSPTALDNICLRALCRSREGRFAGADEMARALFLAASEAGLQATPDDVRQHVQKKFGDTLADRRRRARALFGTAERPPSEPIVVPTMGDDPFTDALTVPTKPGVRGLAPTVVLNAYSEPQGWDKPRRLAIRPIQKAVLTVVGLAAALTLGYWVSRSPRAGVSPGATTAVGAERAAEARR